MNHSPNGHYTVLVVDDEPSIINAIDDLLEEEFHVLGATDPEAALELLVQEEVAVILSDQRMPQMSGALFLGRAKEISAATRILITGYSDPKALILAVNLGQIHAYVNKPWNPEELRLLVLRAAEQYRMHQAVKHSEERLQILIERLPEGVCLLDGDQRLVLANPVGRECLQALGAEGERIANLAGRPLAELLEPRADGLAHQLEVAGPPARVFAVEARPIRATEYALVLRELTQEREIAERVQQQERLAAVGQLAAGIAHDFNNLLTVITGLSQTLERRAELPAQTREGLNTITVYGERAAQMIRQILDFSRSHTVERASVDLEAFLKEGMNTLRQVMPESIKVRVEVAGNHHIMASISQLHQVLTNLVVNARDAMPQGGELVVQTAALRVEREPPLPGMEPGEWVLWRVSDTGTGIPPEVMKRVFEPFFTTKQAQGGTGLGLAQVYGIVKQHQGHIAVQSEPGAGTTFAIYLPRLTQEKGRAAEPEGGKVAGGKGESVLVVEDQAAVLNVVRLILEGLNFRVFAAADGREALALYQQHRDEVSLVLTDWMMPQMSGAELIAALRKIDPGICVVVMSGYAHDRGEIMPDLQVAGWLDKPVKIESLVQTLREALSRRVP